MSHYSTIQTQLVSKKHLVQALRDMGFQKLEVYDTAQILQNAFMNLFNNKAEIIVRSRYNSKLTSDLGFKLSQDGRYNMVIDDFDQAMFDKAWFQRLSQRYAYHVALDTLKEQDFDIVDERVEPNRTIHLTLRRMK